MSKPKRKTLKNTLFMNWSKKENDLLIRYPNKRDGAFLYVSLKCRRFTEEKDKYDNSILDELTSRGYDITTFRMSIRRNDKMPGDS